MQKFFTKNSAEEFSFIYVNKGKQDDEYQNKYTGGG